MEDEGKQADPIHTESLDYQRIYNQIQAERRERARTANVKILGVKPYTIVKSFVTLSIAICVGLLTVGLAVITEYGVLWKNRVIRHILHSPGENQFLWAALAHLAFSNALVLFGAGLVQAWAPAAAGSGVSLVMAYLNGNAVPDLLTFRTMVAKWLGTMCACTASLTLGLEAPMVHLGACVAHCITHATCYMCGRIDQAKQQWRLRRRKAGTDVSAETARAQWLPKDILASDADQREFISAGAAAGLAAAFGAPIGGVLFSMEEASTHWSRKVAWRCFVCTAVCVFTISQISVRWRKGVLSPGDGVTPLNTQEWFLQLPFVIIVSVGGAFLGALFNALHKKLLPYRAPTRNTCLRLLEVSLLTSIIISSMFALAYYLGTCVEVPDWVQQAYGLNFYCPDRTFNDLATAFFSVPNDTIKHIFGLGQYSEATEVCREKNCYFTLRSLLILCPTYLLFMTLIGGLAIPGGLFIPSIMVGSSFGAMMGLLLMKAYPFMNIQPGFYAMCAATAMLGSVFRSYISLVVLVVEGTQSTKFMLGIIIAAMCSNYIVEWIHSDGVYETDLEADGQVIFLRATPPTALLSTTAGQMMNKAVWCFRDVESVQYIVNVLQSTSHNGFPVVEPLPRGEDDEYDPSSGGPSRSGVFKGIILRSQLLVLLESEAFCDEWGRPLRGDEVADMLEENLELDRLMRLFFHHRHIMRRHEATDVEALPASLRSGDLSVHGGEAKETASTASEGSVRSHLGTGGWDEEAGPRPCPLFLDLRPFMDQEPITVRPDTPGERAYAAFVSLGMRHLVVLDLRSHVKGILTRKDLDSAAGQGGWRRNRIAPAPKPPPPEGLHVTGEETLLTRLRRSLASFSDFVFVRGSKPLGEAEEPLLRSPGDPGYPSPSITGSPALHGGVPSIFAYGSARRPRLSAGEVGEEEAPGIRPRRGRAQSAVSPSSYQGGEVTPRSVTEAGDTPHATPVQPHYLWSRPNFPPRSRASRSPAPEPRRSLPP